MELISAFDIQVAGSGGEFKEKYILHNLNFDTKI